MQLLAGIINESAYQSSQDISEQLLSEGVLDILKRPVELYDLLKTELKDAVKDFVNKLPEDQLIQAQANIRSEIGDVNRPLSTGLLSKIKKVLRIGNIQEARLLEATYKEGEALQQFMRSMWEVPQDPKKHPEGNTFKHIASTVNRAIRDAHRKMDETGAPFDIDSVLIAYFHDLGKRDAPSILDHMGISQGIAKQYEDFIIEMGGDPEIIDYVIEYHHHIKPHNWNNPDGKSKFPATQDVKDKISAHRGFQHLQDFEKRDISGLYTASELERDTGKRATREAIINLAVQKLNELFYRR